MFCALLIYTVYKVLDAWGRPVWVEIARNIHCKQTFFSCLVLEPDRVFFFWSCHMMIQAIICRLLEVIWGFNKCSLDWRLYLKFMAPYPHSLQQHSPFYFTALRDNRDVFPKYLFDVRSKKEATVHFMWSAGAAGELALSRLTQRLNKIYSSCTHQRAQSEWKQTDLLCLQRAAALFLFTPPKGYTAWHILHALLLSTRWLLEVWLILRSFSLKDDTSLYSVEMKICW